MRKVVASLLVSMALLVALGTTLVTVAVFAKNTPGINPLSSLRAHTYWIMKRKLGHTFTPNSISGLAPAQLNRAYGTNLLKNKGKGVTVAILDACGNTHAQADLNTYDSTFGLPATTIKVVTPQGTPCSDPLGWGVETDLDIQMVHAIAPAASIVLEAAQSATYVDLLAAAQDAYNNQHATVVSMSFGGDEFPQETGVGFDSVFQTGNNKGVSFTASSGDSGCGGQYPAASPYVTSVGGTSLTVNSNGSYLKETAWSGSGGGFSAYESRPSYQNGFNSGANRGIPDVAMVADPNTGVAMYDTDTGGFIVVGGTSVAAPMWAGVLAMTNQMRSSSMRNADKELYSVASNSTKYSKDYHDIKSGSAGGSCVAKVGYDLVTGLGSSVANNLVPDLVAAP